MTVYALNMDRDSLQREVWQLRRRVHTLTALLAVLFGRVQNLRRLFIEPYSCDFPMATDNACCSSQSIVRVRRFRCDLCCVSFATVAFRVSMP